MHVHSGTLPGCFGASSTQNVIQSTDSTAKLMLQVQNCTWTMPLSGLISSVFFDALRCTSRFVNHFNDAQSSQLHRHFKQVDYALT